MKKVLIIAYHFPPDNSSGVFRSMHFVNCMIERGKWQPVVLTVQEKAFSQEQKKDYSLLSKVDKRVRIIRVKAIHLRQILVSIKHGARLIENNNQIKLRKVCSINKLYLRFKKLKDIITEEVLSFPDRYWGWIYFGWRKGLELARCEKIEAIYCSGSPWSDFLIGLIISKQLKIPLCIDYRDPWNFNPFHNEHTRIYKKFSRYLERMVISNASGIICNTTMIKKDLQKRYVTEASYQTIPNGYEASIVPCANTERVARKGNETLFIHAGSMYGKRSIKSLVKAIKTVLDQHGKCNYRFIIVGENDKAEEQIHNLLDKKTASRYFKLIPPVSHAECISLIENCDICLIFQQGTNSQIPRKIYEYIGLRKPIFAICERGETHDLIEKYKLGLAVKDDCKEIFEGLQEIVKNYNAIKKRIVSDRKLEQFEVKNLTKHLEDMLDRISR